MKMEKASLVSGQIKGLRLPDAPAQGRVNSMAVQDRQIGRTKANGVFTKVPFPPHPIGQYERTASGTFNWTVPDGVRQISAAAIGGGGNGGSRNYSYRYSGGGGGGGAAAAYSEFEVVPGEILTLEVGGSSGRSLIKRQDGSVLLQVDGGKKGGNPQRPGAAPGGSGGSVIIGGGLAGTSGSKGQSGGESNSGGNGGVPGYIGTMPRGKIKPSDSRTFGTGGGGGIGGNGGRHYSYGSGTQADGVVRLIWGDNRHYPSTNTGDV